MSHPPSSSSPSVPAGVSPSSSSDVRFQLEQQQLTNRLYRAHGQAFQHITKQTHSRHGAPHPSFNKPKQPSSLFHDPRPPSQPSQPIKRKEGNEKSSPAKRVKTSEEESKDQDGDSSSSSVPSSVPSASSSSPLRVSSSRYVRSVLPRSDVSTVAVPDTLQPLLGDKLAITTPPQALNNVQQYNRAPFYSSSTSTSTSVSFSKSGQLPLSAEALELWRSSVQQGAHANHSVLTVHKQSTKAEEKRDGDGSSTNSAMLDATQQYEKYLMSPFSFIDKAIDSPYTEEFVYLNPRGPYDLVIVKHDRIDPTNYYTMSRAGVTHFFQTETDFTSLDQWEREYFLFTKMMEIPFFKRFRMWKAFYFWKKYIRRSKLNKCKKILTENLYILNPYLRPSLIQLKALCYAASKWTLFRVDPKHTLTLKQFVADQDVQKSSVMESLNQLNSDVRRIVSEACEVDLKNFLIQNGFRQGMKSNQADGTDAQTNPLNNEFDLDLLNSTFDSNNVDNPQKISHAEKAANRTKCRKLTKYIRLVDYLIIDTLVTLSMDRTADVLSHVERKPIANSNPIISKKPKSNTNNASNNDTTTKKTTNKEVEEDLPLFQVELELQPVNNSQSAAPDLIFVPALEDWQQTIEFAIDSAVKKVMTPKRLIHDPDFYVYTKANVGGAEDGGDGDENNEFKLESMVLEEPSFIQVKSGIRNGLHAAFQTAAVYAQTFEYHRDIYLENVATDISAYADAPINVFSDLILKYDGQIKEFTKMVTSSNIGIIQVDSTNLKNLFLPSPKLRLTEIERLLPTVAREKAKELFEKIKDANNKVSTIPATVEEFVEIMAFLAKIHEQQEHDANAYMFIQELYNLMNEHKIKVIESDKAQFERLTQTRQTFKTSILLSEASINGNTEKFSKELEAEIPILVEDVKQIVEELKDENISRVDADVDDVIQFLEDRDQQLIVLEEKAQRYQYYQDVLQVDIIQYEELREARADLDVKLSLWTSLKTWGEFTNQWMNAKFEKIDVDEISRQVQIYNKVYSKAKRMLENNPVVALLRAKISEFQNTLPVVSDLRNPDLQKHHWEAINKLLAHDVKSDQNFTLGTLIQLNAMQHKQEIAIISNKAQQEAQLQEMLNKVILTWNELNFPVSQHKDQKDVYILGNLDDILAALDDTLVTINTIMGSRFVEPIKELVDDWNHKLMLFQDTVEEWANCQRQWLYLETIFNSQDIVRQLPDEFTMFSKVDRAWKEIMRRTNDNPNCIVAGTYPGLRDNFHNYNAILDRVQKQLESYLETRRQQFPRFYFISNDELLRILAQSKNVQAVQPHLRKCFDNIMKLEFADKDIKAMYSSEGERVPLGMNLKARGSAEVWLPALETDMVKSLRRYMKRGVTDYERMTRRDWVLEKFGQVVCTVGQIAWTRGCEQAICEKNSKIAISRWYEAQINQLSELTALIRGNLSSTDRKKIVALITQDVHGRDVVGALRDDEVSSLNNFTWQQQLRFYWDTDEDDCIVRQSNAKFFYGYEYMGVTSRLVITPLTDRCWMTISGALHIRFGAAPAGPAGTGKTESSKDLAKALGIFCVVFNCSEQINYKTMAKLFSGLAQAGAWTCLDEFNRIDIEVLSVIAAQLLQVRQALLLNATDFNFQGQQIKLKSTFGCIITMNPGYAGRTELPDNLKVLFRSVSMMIPDYALIAEIMLFAEGFDNAQQLSKKMVKLYKLASEQLSQQDHYDFGMRAVKSVLVMAGALKRSEPDLNEDVVLIRAMRDSNVPKFLSDDLPLFAAIVQDLFPGVQIPEPDYGELDTAIRKNVEISGLQPVPGFMTKVIQLYDTFLVRFGVMIVGPTGAGKSACHDILAKAMTSLREAGSANEQYQVVHTHTLNPKCITMDELYGSLSPMTGEWTDGLGSSIMRDAMKDTSPDKHWCIFDGPVDALWIENMNTVLDDNMTLCLVNGERIKLKNDMRMLFEVADLAVASPATVSRCGMVYLSTELGYLPYVKSWLPKFEQISPELEKHILNLFESKLPLGINFIRENCKEPIPTVDIQITASLCSLFEALFTVENGVDFNDSFDDLKLISELLFAFCFTWSLGGSLDSDGQKLFAKFCMDTFINVRPPLSFFDSYLDVREKSWKNWEALVPNFEYDAKLPYFQMIVPTVDTVRYQSLLETLLGVEKSVFFTGHTGVGKSVIVLDLFAKSKDTKKYSPLCLTFSAQTNARKTQETIEGKLVKYRKTLLGAPQGKQVIIFVDDVNMPELQTFGASPPIELLRQFCDYRGFYDREKLFWKSIADTTLVCAAAPPGGGRNVLTSRFIRHFNVLCLPQPTENIMKKIFSAILNGFLNQFKANVQKLKDPIVNSTVELYESISKELLPTPAKSHYTFNLRDISKVFQGILMIKPLNCSIPETMTRLWIHESQRCFSDRLINADDKSWFNKKLTHLINKQFGVAWTYEEMFEREPIMFGDWFRPGVERSYEENTKGKQVSFLLDEYLDEYNLSSQNKQNLVFFQDAVEHISRISRVLRQPRGNAMLVGVGGSGKQSLTRLACFMAEMKCYELEITRGFGVADFQEHLKKIMIAAGVAGKDCVFLFTENQIVSESFLEDINSILNSGEVPNLFPQDELVKVIEDLTPIVRDMGLPPSRAVVYNQFVQRVRDHLHIVLCMSPIGNEFRTRIRKFPSLISCMTIDWYTKWPADSLRMVANRFLKEVELPSEECRAALVKLCVDFHLSVEDACERFMGELRRRVYTTPKSYLDLINLYLSMLAERRHHLGTQRNHLMTGLSKLSETKAVVSDLRETLTKLKPVLVEKTKETEVLLQQVAIDTEKADKVRAVVEVEESEVAKRTEEVREVQADAQADLDLALPALRAAIKALDKLKKAEISEVKSMANPPTGVVRTMEAVCILFNTAPDWENAKKLLTNVNFLKMLKEYDKDHIDPRAIKKLQKYITDPELTEERMSNVSRAATAILQWVNAMVEYSKVAKVVAPKRQRVEQMNALLKEANAKLQEKQAQLQEVVNNVTILKDKCEKTLAEKISLDAKSTQTEKRLERAEKLTSGLAIEEIRWAKDAEDIGAKILDLVGNAFISAACVSYYGPFTGEYRKNLVQLWHAACLANNIPTSADYTLAATLGNPVEIRQWNINGLPTDDVSIDSGILVKRSFRWPLAIDPQEQAKKWIKNEHKNKLLLTKFSSKDMLKTVETAIRTGSPLLIEDVHESIDAAIDPILLKQIFIKGDQKYVHLGENDVEYNDKFRLYMTTKIANPHYLPEQQIKVTLLNFTVTRSGLEDQLLGDVVKKERFDIEEKKNRLVVMMAKDRKQLSDIEDRILLMLSESSGNILDDEALIDTLEESKFTSNVIHDRVKESIHTQKDISEIREQYRSVAIRGSLLYFVISDLSLIDPMYQWSLSYFLRLFNMCMDQAQQSDQLKQRLENLLNYITSTTYVNISRGLFEAHKLTYSFLTCVSIMRERGGINDLEWNLLVRNGAGVPVKMSEQPPNPLPEFIGERSWEFVCTLDNSLPVMKGIVGDMLININGWKQYIFDANPQATQLPGSWSSKLNAYQKLLILKALRFEKLMFGLSDFVLHEMGRTYIDTAQTSLEEVYKDSDRQTPVIFVLSQGADPTGLLFRFAKERKFEEKLNVLSLGQGQGDNAVRLIEQARTRGEWVLLQNCHLAKSWMPVLEELVESFSSDDSGKSNDEFRLWLTSMPCSYFPVSVLQKGIKLTNEPPAGLRANLLRSYANVINANEFETINPPTKAAAFKKLLFGLCFFHANIQERKKFGSLGWNKVYEFNDSDLETSIQVLRMFLEEQEQIPWDALRYVIGQINYGGRVTDDLDRRCLMSILNNYFTPDILNDSYTFSPSGTYYAPATGNLHSYINYLESLPLAADPEIFGMHENANLTFQRNSSTNIVNTVLSIQPREIVSASGLSSDTIVASMAVEMEEKMPQLLDKKKAGAETFKITSMGVMDSLGTVLLQEMERFNRVLVVMRRTLADIQRAIRGEVVMSQDLDMMYSSLLNNQVPDVWSRVAYPSLKPLASWVKDLHARIAFMREWLTQGAPNSFWLSGFFFPQGFMTGALQNHSRKYRIPIDTLSFSFQVLDIYDRKQVERPPEDGILIDGLFLDGARWDEQQKVLADSKLGELFAPVPIIHFCPTDVLAQHAAAASSYVCPVYKTSVRAGVLSTTGQSTNFVLSVNLPTKQPPAYWVLKGAALLCALDY